MRKKVIFILIFGLEIVFSQSITQEEKNQIINNLDSVRHSIRLEAIISVLKSGITEALPKLETKIFQQEKDIAIWYLRTISVFNAPNVNSIAHRFIDTIDYLPDPVHLKSTGSTNRLKVEATQLLFQRGDYSTAYIVFDYIEENKPGIATSSFNLLLEIFDHVPDYELPAKNELKRIMLNLNEEYYSSIAIIYLTEKYAEEMLPDLLYVINNSLLSTSKNIAFEELEKLNYPELENLVKVEFLRDSVRAWMMLNKLLTDYNTPRNYKFILDNYKNVLQHNQVSFYTELFNSTELSAPLYPPSFSTLSEQFDYFKDLCDSLVDYSWLGDSQFKNELQSILQTAKTNIQNEDSLACRVQVKTFQDLVDNVYKDSLNTDPRFVTIEGWKFLYWNAQYILDRLPTPAVVTELELNEITPAMSMKNNPGAFTMELNGNGFTSSSVVYFNGNTRATTYVSDSTVTAQILSSDVSASGNFPLWVSDGTTNSDTVVFSVVNNLPKEITPIMNCVTNNGNGTYTAYFGYDNKNSVSVFVPVYAQNKVSPAPWDRGQPGVFQVGIQEKVFSVTWTSGNIIWHLNNNIATAKKTSPPCQ